MPDYQERRRYPRYTCDLGIEVRPENGQNGYWGTLADICLGGCYVYTFSPMPAETAVALRLKSTSVEIALKGRVVTFHPGVGMGIEFLSYSDPDGETKLKALLHELEGKAAGAAG